MIAAVDMHYEVVWGVGNNPQQAMTDAHQHIKRWQELTGMEAGKLDIVPIRDDAPLDDDGEELFKYCVFEEENHTQLGLF